jgi:uncharacterized protein affecting Mg2+/Co2+ transport
MSSPPPSATRPLYRALLRELARIARARASFPLRAPLDSDVAWGQHRFAPAGAAYEQEALAALLPSELPVPPDALFPPATPPEGSGASPDFVPQRRYGARELKRLAAANFRAPLEQQQEEAGAAAAAAAGGAAATASAAALVPRMALALAALRALPEQLVLERGSSSAWHEGVLVEATARFMHASPPSPSSSSSPSSAFAAAMRGSGGGGGAVIGGGAMPLGLPPHVQAAAARLLGVQPLASGGGGGGSSGNEAGDDDDDEDEDDYWEEEEDSDDGSASQQQRRRRQQQREQVRRRRAAMAARHQHHPLQQHVFTYRVRVTNARGAEGAAEGNSNNNKAPRVQVLGREWSIWGSDGELKGLVPLSTANAVVGQQPVLPYGACFEYASGTPLQVQASAMAASSGSSAFCAGSMKGRLALAVQQGSGGQRITATPLVVPIDEFALVLPDAAFQERQQEEEQEEQRWRWLCAA